jgi:hypothetical protein
MLNDTPRLVAIAAVAAGVRFRAFAIFARPFYLSPSISKDARRPWSMRA